MIHGIHKYKKTIEKLQELGVKLHSVKAYCGDEQELLCVVNKKELRKYLRPALLQVWRIREYLRTERKFLKILTKTNQPIEDNHISRVRLLNSMFNDFYATYKYSHRFQMIHFLNNQFFDLIEEEKCKHWNTTPSYEYVRCNDCGSIKTDSGSSWGIAKNKWFNSESEAKFYKNNGYLPK